jgi:hypothetical protein
MFTQHFIINELKVIPALCSLHFELIPLVNPNPDCYDFSVFVLLIITKKFVFFPYPLVISLCLSSRLGAESDGRHFGV